MNLSKENENALDFFRGIFKYAALYNGDCVTFIYKEENFAHLIGLHKLKDIQIIQFWQDRKNKTVKLADVIKSIKRGKLTDAALRASHFFPLIRERYESFSYDNLTTLNYTDVIVNFNHSLINSKIKSKYILFDERPS